MWKCVELMPFDLWMFHFNEFQPFKAIKIDCCIWDWVSGSSNRTTRVVLFDFLCQFDSVGFVWIEFSRCLPTDSMVRQTQHCLRLIYTNWEITASFIDIPKQELCWKHYQLHFKWFVGSLMIKFWAFWPNPS